MDSRHRWLRPLLLCAAMAAGCPAGAAQPADLTALSLESLMQLNVVGASKYEQKQSEVAAAVSVITRSEIKAYGWRTLAEALASLPGVHTSYDRQYTYLGTRGFGLPGDLTTRLLITINGNRINDPIYDQGPGGREFPLDLDLVERIEFIPGPGGAVYGQNAMFGVVNLITRQGADVAGNELALAHQQPQRLIEGRASWGRKLDNGIDVLVSASALHARGSDPTLDFGVKGVQGRAVGLDGERLTQFFGRVARSNWSFDFVHGDRSKSDPTAAFFSDPLVPGQGIRDSYSLVHLHYTDAMADDTLRWTARLFAGRYFYRGSLSYDNSPYAFPADSDWNGAELQLLWTAWTGHKLMVGLEAQANSRTNLSALDLAAPANDVRVTGSGRRLGVYAQDEWRITPTLNATLGVRADHHSATGTSVSPRAALIWQPAATTSLKMLYGRARRAPNTFERDFDDGTSQIANPALKGEHIDTLEWVLDHRVGTDLGLRGSLYRWSMHDIVTLGTDAASGMTQYQAGATVRARGLELSADKTWAAGTRLRGSVTLQDAVYVGGAGLPNAPRMLGKLNLSSPLPWAGLSAGYEWQYESARRTLDGTRLAGHALSNLHLTAVGWAPGLELSLHVANLFDRRYALPAARSNWQSTLEQDGRALRAQASYRF